MKPNVYIAFVLLLLASTLRAAENPFVELDLKRGEMNFDGLGSVAFSPDSKKVIASDNRSTVLIWEVESGKKLLQLDVPGVRLDCAAFLPDGKRAFTSGSGIVGNKFTESACIWDVESGKELHTLEGRAGLPAFSPLSADGKKVATFDTQNMQDRVVRIWDTESGKELQKIEGVTGSFFTFSLDGKKIITGILSSTVHIWDAEASKELQKLEEPTRMIYFATFSPDGKTVVTASHEGGRVTEAKKYIIRLWDAETGKELHRVEDARFAAFASEGKKVATVGMDEMVRIWDAASGNVLCRFGEHVVTVAVSPDGKKVATAKYNSTVQIWDIDTGKELHYLEGHMGIAIAANNKAHPVVAVAFSPDGKKVVSAAHNARRTLLVWDLEQVPPVKQPAEDL